MTFVLESNDLNEYLLETEEVNYTHPMIQHKISELFQPDFTESQKIEIAFKFVRDQIPHSWDIQSDIVTRTASEVLEKQTGICYAKSNLLAALLRGIGIPCGFCYQRLMIFDTPEKGYCLHAFNAAYIEDLQKWIRIDARGNKPGVHAEFSLGKEQLAFHVNVEMNEQDYLTIFMKPNEKTMETLRRNRNAIRMYKYSLPDTL
ncbi:transglutaminase-like domain-containing protein [Solibacillus sp. FSL K6-1523]|uniref:transglutaminase-like domain-containing protein n=1 Tax=Solibacillus sp. FSL K6-1523 TaxID=2921471 RepID=UPI0030F57E95